MHLPDHCLLSALQTGTGIVLRDPCYGMFHSLQVPEVLSLRATDGGLSSVHPQIRTACSCAGYEG